MRLDFEMLLSMIKDSERYKEMYERFYAFSELEQYTLLTPPFKPDDVRELLTEAQKKLKFRFSQDYYLFLKCCDGGLLFTNALFSVCSPEDVNGDLTEMNLYLRQEGTIPKESAAIGMTNYGGWIVQRASGKNGMGIWDPDEGNGEGGYVAQFDTFYDWLDDTVQEARYLMQTDALPVIEDPDDEA